MDKNRRNKKFRNNQNQNRNNGQNQNYRSNDNNNKVIQHHFNAADDENARKEKEKNILEIKNREIICPKCGQQITDITSALTDKQSGQPIHFDCALSEVSKNENLAENEKIAYIGQGRFGVLSYENIRDQRHFTIKKIIEWEDRENKAGWRNELSEAYSKIN